MKKIGFFGPALFVAGCATAPTAPGTPAEQNSPQRLRSWDQQSKQTVAVDRTSSLTNSEIGAIGDHMRACWPPSGVRSESDAPTTLSARIIVIYRADGIVRLAEVNDRDRTKLRDPTFRAFAERAMHAVRDPKCSNLPLPERDRGAIGSLHVTFKP